MKASLAVFALFVSVAACDRTPSAAAVADPTASATSDSGRIAPASAEPPRAAPSTSVAADPLSRASASAADAAARTGIDSFFAQYKDGSDFEFLRTACVSPIDRFVSFRHADIGAVIASARRFFRDKWGLKYLPDTGALRLASEGAGSVARLPITMIWGVRPPPDWSPYQVVIIPDAGEVDPLWAGLIEHTAAVDVEMAFDASGRITRYAEGPEHHGLLRFNGAKECIVADPGVPVTALTRGVVVTDLGDRYATFITPKGPEVIRHVRLPDGDEAWVNDSRAWAVPNPAGGTSAGGTDCLEAIPGRDGGQ